MSKMFIYPHHGGNQEAKMLKTKFWLCTAHSFINQFVGKTSKSNMIIGIFAMQIYGMETIGFHFLFSKNGFSYTEPAIAKKKLHKTPVTL